MIKKLIILFILLALSISPVFAYGPYTSTMTADGYDSSPDSIATPNQSNGPNNIYNAINHLLGTSYTNNQSVDFLQYTGNDNTWVSTSGQSPFFAAISLSAGNTNTLSTYNINNPSLRNNPFGLSFAGGETFLGDGSIDHPYLAGTSPLAAGSLFQFNLTSSSHGLTFEHDSNPVNNIEGYDQMLTYHLSDLQNKTMYVQSVSGSIERYTFTDPYLITWEDVALDHDGANSDKDYNDLVFLVDRAAPVAAPEPISIVLYTVGGLLMAAALLRRRWRLA